MIMKSITASLLATLIFGTAALAQDGVPKSDNKVASPASDITKKSRKKKVEMCSECGKPESECDCHDKDSGKPGTKKAEKKEGT